MSGSEAGKVGRNALIYLVPNLLLRGLNFLLAPILTLYLTPADYGVVGLASTFTLLFGILLGLAIHGSVTRLHHECATPDARAVFYGSLLLFLLFGSGTGAVLIELSGQLGAFDGIRSVRFHPHLELALWAAYAQLFVVLRTTMLQAQEQARSVAALNAVGILLQTSVSLFLVIAWDWGATGVLVGQVVGQSVLGLFCIWAIGRESTLTFSRERLLQALAFSLPLLPHLAANWGLSVSDRLILERSVSTAELGIYSLGYMFCTISAMIAGSIGDALSPAIMRLLRANPTSTTVPTLGTLAIAAIGWACTGAAILGGDAIMLMTPPSYWGATSVVPWVVLGAALQGVYLVVSQGTWFSMRTRAVPFVTLAAAAANVILNILFIPRFGIMAAAVNTAVAYGIMAVLHERLAARLHRIAWEYGKWALVAGAGLGCFALSRAIPASAPIGAVLVCRALLAALAYPLVLQVTKVVDLRRVARREVL